jgi:hypothetical protein
LKQVGKLAFVGEILYNNSMEDLESVARRRGMHLTDSPAPRMSLTVQVDPALQRWGMI